MKNLVICNLQSFGDILLSTHIARLSRKYLPGVKVHFFVRSDLTLTTAETNPEALLDVLKIIEQQDNIESVGLIRGDQLLTTQPITDFKILVIQGWSSDLGIVKSQLKPFYDMFNIDEPIDTETKFNVGIKKTLTTKKVVGLAGKLDFLRKWNNEEEYNKLRTYLDNHKVVIKEFGVDISNHSYSDQLKELNCCDLLISPMGSLIHAAAGLNVNTISLTSVFPSEYDCPEYYHSGWHRSIKKDYPKHCGTFKCVVEKPYDNQTSWGNPPTMFGFWPKECGFMNDNKSCVYNIQAQDVIELFEEWYNEDSRI